MAKVRTGQTAPTFKLTTARGEDLSLAEALAHGPVVLSFFKTTCPVCQFTFPFIERLYKAYGGGQVAFWGISQDDAADTEVFCSEYGVTFPALLDDDGYPVSNDYGLTNVPTYYLIAPDGKIRIDSVGFTKKALERISDELAHSLGRPVAHVFLPGEIVPDSKPG